MSGVSTCGGVATADNIIKNGEEKTGFNTDQEVGERWGSGDIRVSGSGEGGSFGGFETGNQEIGPDDAPPLGVCRSRNVSLGVMLWDEQGICLSERREGGKKK